MQGMGRASSGMKAARILMDVAGENLANENNPDYRRKKASQASVPGASDTSISIGNGVEVESITRMRDELAERALVANTQVEESLKTTSDVLSNLESIFQEPAENGLDAQMGDLFENIKQLASDPRNESLRRSVVKSGESVTMLMNQIDGEMENAYEHAHETLRGSAQKVNELAEEVAELNLEIMHGEASGTRQTALRDKREAAIGELAEHVDVRTHTTDQGHVNVRVGGSLLVSGTDHLTTEVERTEGATKLVAGSDQPLDINEGQVGGLLSVVNEMLPQYEDQLDTLANGLRREFNLLHSTGLPGGGRFEYMEGDSMEEETHLDSYGVPATSSGQLFLNVEDPDGGVSQHEINDLDTDVEKGDLARQVADEIDDEIPHLSASQENGRLVIDADSGYKFGFSTPYDPNPEWEGGSDADARIVGDYESEQNLEYTVRADAAGEVGDDPISVTVEVEDEDGNTETYSRQVEEEGGFQRVSLGNGLSLELEEDSLSAGDSLSFDARADMDPQGILDPLGVNTFFQGKGAGEIEVEPRLADDPNKLATSVQSVEGDNQRLLDMLELEEKEVLDGSSLKGFYRDLTGDISTNLNNEQTRLKSVESLSDNLQDRRDAASSVSADEEIMQIMQSQRIYQGVARYVQALDSAYNDLFNIL